MLIHVDANIPVYVWGREHPLKRAATDVFDLIALHPASFFTDAEVLQELLHRYRALGMWDSVRDKFAGFAELVSGRIEPMLEADVLAAADLAGRYPQLSARDLIHVAVMLRAGARHIVSADSGFDVITEVERLDPLRADEWRGVVTAG